MKTEAEIKALVDQWLAWDRNEETRAEIQKLWDAKDMAQLDKLLGSRMEFGTAGLRSRMGAGNSQMNHLTIIQTAQGLAAYLHSKFSDTELAARGVAIGFDGRHHSNEFAGLTASVFKASHIKSYLYDRVVPTPFVPFAVLKFHCVAGVMVTASHNPKFDNGYKVYWENGAQIVPPHDKGIAEAITQNLEPKASSWEMGKGDSNPYQEMFDAYFGEFLSKYTRQSKAAPIKFVYSAMHGVGAPFTMHALNLMGVTADHLFSVKEQELPDPEFSTVEFPNPEEGKTSLELSTALGDRNQATVILANDPDADRLALAERTPEGTWRLFNGNEMGALFGWWAVTLAKQRGDDLSRSYFFSSTVSSSVLGSIAAKEGAHFEDTLTGFKWMGSCAQACKQAGKGDILFAFEEAIGFMWGDQVFDKDGVRAAGVLADMANHLWDAHHRTLAEQLEEIYKTYGYHFSSNSYVVARDPAKIAQMFDEIKGVGPTASRSGYPTTIAGAKVEHVRDLSTGLDTRQSDRKATLPLSKSSPMITFYLNNGVKLTVRGSGTEPKLKWYTELVTPDPNGRSVVQRFTAQAVNELVQPEKFGFQRRKEDIEAASSL